MTENEAIGMLKIQRTFTNSANAKVEAIDMAIQALEEIQQYRAIGTVEQLQFMKSVCDMSDDMLKSLADSIRARMKYEAIGSVEEFKALKEKNEPKEMDRYSCPICRHYFEDTDAYNYCPICGQKMKPIWQ